MCVAGAVVWIASRATTAVDDGPRLLYRVTRGDLAVTVVEQGILESAENTEIKCKVRGRNTVLWVIPSGTMVQPGDALVRIDSSFIEEQIDERTKYAHWSRSSAERSSANVVRAELAVSEYEEGRFVAERLQLEKNLVVAQAGLRSAESQFRHAKQMADIGYSSELKVEETRFAREQADLDVALKRTQLDVLTQFSHAERLQTLKGQLSATKANHEANAERAMADASRRDRALDELPHCVVRAERAGLVIHPNAAKWETAPIAQGSLVWKNQVLLLMPDLSRMQVKVGVHELFIDRMKPGLDAKIKLPQRVLTGAVSDVASVTRPAGWWTGNEVRYDTMVSVPSGAGVMPGMSAEVEITLARYEDVLTIPVAGIVEQGTNTYCWVQASHGPERRRLRLGDSDGVFTIVEQGLVSGESVYLNPQSFAATRGDGQEEPGVGVRDPKAKPSMPAKPSNLGNLGNLAESGESEVP